MNTAVELVAVTQSAAGTSYNEQQFDATSLLLTPSFPGAGWRRRPGAGSMLTARVCGSESIFSYASHHRLVVVTTAAINTTAAVV